MDLQANSYFYCHGRSPFLWKIDLNLEGLVEVVSSRLPVVAARAVARQRQGGPRAFHFALEELVHRGPHGRHSLLDDLYTHAVTQE